MIEPKVLVLGVGNILLADEGAGVHAVKELESKYDFPPEVRLLDGGTLGLALMDFLLGVEHLIVVDAVRGGHEPGTVYRLENEALRKSQGFSDSMHQLDLLDTLNMYELVEGKRPATTVFGIEPGNIEDLSLEMTAETARGFGKLCRAVLDELAVLGYPATPK